MMGLRRSVVVAYVSLVLDKVQLDASPHVDGLDPVQGNTVLVIGHVHTVHRHLTHNCICTVTKLHYYCHCTADIILLLRLGQFCAKASS